MRYICVRCELLKQGHTNPPSQHYYQCPNKENTMIEDNTPLHAQASLAQQRAIEAASYPY